MPAVIKRPMPVEKRPGRGKCSGVAALCNRRMKLSTHANYGTRYAGNMVLGPGQTIGGFAETMPEGEKIFM